MGAKSPADHPVTYGPTLYCEGYKSTLIYPTAKASTSKPDALEQKLNQMIDCLDGNIDETIPLDADGYFSRAWVTRKSKQP